MRTISFLRGAGLVLIAAFACSLARATYAGPRRVNQAIELLEAGQPAYYTYGQGGYKEGRALAKTWADIVMYDMEGEALDFAQLREFMRGLVDAGPTASGHRTPAVIVTLPLYGLSASEVLANHWMIQQALACGIHGLHLCHARDPDAVRAFIRAARFEIHHEAVGDGLDEGIRMFGAHKFAAWVWGVSPQEYYERADPWPLNPKGELLMGVKIEDHVALEHTDETLRVPGIAFAEWGPRDTSYANGFFQHALDYGRKPGLVPPPPLKAAADRVIAACKAAKIRILDNVRPEDVTAQIDAGITICAGGIKEAADVGRRYTHCEMPH